MRMGLEWVRVPLEGHGGECSVSWNTSERNHLGCFPLVHSLLAFVHVQFWVFICCGVCCACFASCEGVGDAEIPPCLGLVGNSCFQSLACITWELDWAFEVWRCMYICIHSVAQSHLSPGVIMRVALIQQIGWRCMDPLRYLVSLLHACMLDEVFPLRGGKEYISSD